MLALVKNESVQAGIEVDRGGGEARVRVSLTSSLPAQPLAAAVLSGLARALEDSPISLEVPHVTGPTVSPHPIPTPGTPPTAPASGRARRPEAEGSPVPPAARSPKP